MDLAALVAPVTCPACGHVLTDLSRVSWGMVPREPSYGPGEPVEWLRLPDGRLAPPFRLVAGRWNSGDPAVADVILRDPSYLDGPVRCPGCAAVFEGVCVDVRGGRFAGARLFRAGELPDGADAFEPQPDGSMKPHPEWLDAPVFPLGHE